jgi:hypothetical protein
VKSSTTDEPGPSGTIPRLRIHAVVCRVMPSYSDVVRTSCACQAAGGTSRPLYFRLSLSSNHAREEVLLPLVHVITIWGEDSRVWPKLGLPRSRGDHGGLKDA